MDGWWEKWMRGWADGWIKRGLGLFNQGRGVREFQPRKPQMPRQNVRKAPSMT